MHQFEVFIFWELLEYNLEYFSLEEKYAQIKYDIIEKIQLRFCRKKIKLEKSMRVS